MGLPLNVIKHLRAENIITSRKNRREYNFEWGSVERFQSTFDRGDHLTISQCAEKLRKHGYYSEPTSGGSKKPKGRGRNKPKSYMCSLGSNEYYIQVITLINGTDWLPDEYRLKYIDLGKTRYIKKESFTKTLNWLMSLDKKVNPKIPFVQWVNVNPEKKRPRTLSEKLLKKRKKIKSRIYTPEEEVASSKREDKFKKRDDILRKILSSRLTVSTSS